MLDNINPDITLQFISFLNKKDIFNLNLVSTGVKKNIKHIIIKEISNKNYQLTLKEFRIKYIITDLILKEIKINYFNNFIVNKLYPKIYKHIDNITEQKNIAPKIKEILTKIINKNTKIIKKYQENS